MDQQPQQVDDGNVTVTSLGSGPMVVVVPPPPPIISITSLPTSPSVAVASSVTHFNNLLEDNLRELRNIVHSVQCMKDDNLRNAATISNSAPVASRHSLSSQHQLISPLDFAGLSGYGRRCGADARVLSNSCPELQTSTTYLNRSPSALLHSAQNNTNEKCGNIGSDDWTNSVIEQLRVYNRPGRPRWTRRSTADLDVDLNAWYSVNDIFRRRSWAALEDLSDSGNIASARSIPRRLQSPIRHLVKQTSLSSFDSTATGEDEDDDDEVDDIEDDEGITGSTQLLLDSPPTRRRRRVHQRQLLLQTIKPTHSVAPNQLTLSAMNPSSRDSDRTTAAILDPSIGTESAVPSETSIHKSISTPSLFATLTGGILGNTAADGQNVAKTSSQYGVNQETHRRKTVTSEEDDDDMLLLQSQRPRLSSDCVDSKSQPSVAAATITCDKSSRRKRGSLFFRKKKQHQQTSSNTNRNSSNNAPVGSTSSLASSNLSIASNVQEKNRKLLSLTVSAPAVTGSSSVAASAQKQASDRNSSHSHNHNNNNSSTTVLCYSPWRRVANKLGLNPLTSRWHSKQQLYEDNDDFYYVARKGCSYGNSANFDLPSIPNAGSNSSPTLLEFLMDKQPVINDLEEVVKEVLWPTYGDGSEVASSCAADWLLLGLHLNEQDTWTPTVPDKQLLKKLSAVEIKRQEHIYEFIQTEKHHCLTLILMQKIFVDGLIKHFKLGPNLERMFPRLRDLSRIHLGFLKKLRIRQKSNWFVESIADVLLEQFGGNEAEQLTAAYGEFCSRHRDAVDIYKYYLQHDPKFAEFVKHCQNNPLLKKKGIPECILFVTQRLTKYQLLITPLIKTCPKDNKVELDQLNVADSLVRSIARQVDDRVAEKEKADRKLEIYNRIEAKSFAMYKNRKFKKSDLLADNRKLIFEDVATLMLGRTKMQIVLIVVLTDVLLFLTENNNKLSFFTPDGKPGILQLQTLLVREKPGTDSIYLISSDPANPEMFEIKIHKPKDRKAWIDMLRDATKMVVEQQPDDEESITSSSNDVTNSTNIKSDKLKNVSPKKKRTDAVEDRNRWLHRVQQKQIRVLDFNNRMNRIIEFLRQKDVEQALIYEEKMGLLMKLLNSSTTNSDMPPPPSYCHLVSQYLDSDTIRKQVLNTIQKVNEITTSTLYPGNAASINSESELGLQLEDGTNLYRSASSVGERQNNGSSALPKRAETFGGFDSTSISNNSTLLLTTAKGAPSLMVDANGKPVADPVLDQHQSTVVQLTSHIYTLASIISQQITSIENLETRLGVLTGELNQEIDAATAVMSTSVTAESDSSGAQQLQPKRESIGGGNRKAVYKHEQQLEELRNLQDKFNQQKEHWQQQNDQQVLELEQQKQELLKLQEQVRNEQNDVAEQREQLYRKLELLSAQGLLLDGTNTGPPNSNMSIVEMVSSLAMTDTGISTKSRCSTPAMITTSVASTPLSSNITSANSGVNNSGSSTNTSPSIATPSSLPLNLLSITNQQKVANTNMMVKQQIPLKLASKLGTNGGSSQATTRSSSMKSSSHSQQQIIPWKLREDSAKMRPGGTTTIQQVHPWKLRDDGPASVTKSAAVPQQIIPWKLREDGNSGGESPLGKYDRLEADGSPTHSHCRTGSSPAAIMPANSGPASVPSQLLTSSSAKGGAVTGIGQTNTYPKRTSGSSTQSSDSRVSSSMKLPSQSDEDRHKRSSKDKNKDEQQNIIFF